MLFTARELALILLNGTMSTSERFKTKLKSVKFQLGITLDKLAPVAISWAGRRAESTNTYGTCPELVWFPD